MIFICIQKENCLNLYNINLYILQPAGLEGQS